MASLINELRREATTVKWTVATFLGGAINSVLWSQYLFFYQHLFSGVETLTIFSFLFAMIIVIYSIVSSLLLPMKRVVAPSDIQLVSFALILAIGIAALHENIYSYIVITGSSFVFLFLLGLVQDIIVTKIIGLYGSEADCRFDSYSVTMPFKSLSKKLKEKEFSKATGIVKHSKLKGTEIEVFHTKPYEGFQIFLFLRAAPNRKKSHSQINIVSYERTKYGIRNSKNCEYQTRMILSLLSELFGIKKNATKGEFYNKSIEYSLKPTKNKLESERIDMRITLGCLILLFIGLPVVMFQFGYLSSIESLIAIEIPAVLAVLLQLFRRETK